MPGWLQPVSLSLPSAHVFEGMRSVLVDGVFRGDLLLNAIGLNVIFLFLGTAIFMFAFRRARVRGLLLQIGE